MLLIYLFMLTPKDPYGLLPLDELLEKFVRSVLQNLFLFCDGIKVIGKLLFQFLKLLELLTNLL